MPNKAGYEGHPVTGDKRSYLIGQTEIAARPLAQPDRRIQHRWRSIDVTAWIPGSAPRRFAHCSALE